MTEFKVGDKVTSDYGDGEIKYGPYTSDFADGVYLVADADGVHRPINVDYLTARPAFEVDDQATWHDELVTIKAGPFPDSDGPRWCVVNDEGEYSLAMQEYLSPLPQPAPLKVGDRIRILKEGLHDAPVHFGEILRVSSTDVGDEKFGALQGHEADDAMPWVFPYSAEGTGWERVTEDTAYHFRGVKYDLSRPVYDSSNDPWTFTGKYAPNGDPLMSCYAPGSDSEYHDWTFEKLHDYYNGKLSQEDTETINGVTYVMGARYRDRDGDVWKFTRVGDTVRGSCDGTPPDASCTTIITVVDAFGPLTRLTD